MTGLATASFFAFGALLVLFGANVAEIIEELDLDYAAFGLLASALSLGLGVGILSAGPLTDRLPRRPLFGLSCACVALACLSVGPGISYEKLVACSAMIGFGAGFYETLLNTTVVEQSGITAPRRLLFVHAAATLGAATTPFAIALLREPLDLAWYDMFHAAGFLHVALIFGLLLIPNARSVAFDAHREPPRPARESRVALTAICIATFAYVGVESALTFFVADHVQRDLGFAADRSSGVVGFFWMGLFCGRLIIGLLPLEPAAGTTSLMSLASGAMLLAFFSAGIVGPEWAMGLTGAFLGGVFPIMIALAGLAMPAATGMAVALAAGLGSLGGFLIPWSTGLIANATSLGFALSTLALWLLVLTIAAASLARRQPR
jgi:fucose permease